MKIAVYIKVGEERILRKMMRSVQIFRLSPKQLFIDKKNRSENFLFFSENI